MKKDLNINDYTYPLPQERIALYPLEKRDHSRLLVYDHGDIRHEQFFSLPDFLPSNAFLFFNDTRVIPARLYFQKETGAEIEIFLLHPVHPSPLLVEAMQAQHSCTWQCTIGNLKRWTEGKKLTREFSGIRLEAELLERSQGIIRFQWDGDRSFAEIISLTGETPLPPYLKRKAESSDRERYQTIYSHYEGAVAAPTAGLHFTDQIFQLLGKKQVRTDFVTLHVSAGTFQPVKTERAADHVMHREQIVVSRKNVANLLQENAFIIPVGTTSLRTLESLYWFGVKLLQDKSAAFTIAQEDPYTLTSSVTVQEAIGAVAAYMDRQGMDTLIGETALYIMPGYTFRVCKGLITNFHQPGSTLILLVAAFIGENWRRVYEEALQNNYRFLSYGDSSLLLP